MGYDFNLMNIIGSIMGVATEQGGALGESMSSLALLVQPLLTSIFLQQVFLSSCILRGQLPSTHHYTERTANISDHSDKAATNGGSTFLALLHVKGGSSQHLKT